MAKAATKAAKAVEAPATPAAGPDSTSGAPETSKGVSSIEVTDPPFSVGDKRVARFTLEPLTFSQFVETSKLAEVARLRDKAAPDMHRKYQQREQLRMRLRARDEGGAVIPMTTADVLLIPRRYAGTLLFLANRTNEPMPEMLSDEAADGVTRPVHIKLGTPLKMMGGDGAVAIEFAELEFSGRTFGDVEDLLALEGAGDQALALVRNCSTPIGTISLLRPTDAMIEQLSITDGLFIVDKVLPRFFRVGRDLAKGAEVMRYHSASAGDLRPLPISALLRRFDIFSEVHKNELKRRAALAGFKV